MNTQSTLRLRAVKTIHTMAWAFFAGCILAIPVYTWRDELMMAAILCGIVFLEVIILLLNNWRCPLTDVAAQFTENRADNFDIYLPAWLAKYNKEIFGSIYMAGILYVLVKWLGWFG